MKVENSNNIMQLLHLTPSQGTVYHQEQPLRGRQRLQLRIQWLLTKDVEIGNDWQ
jgi:hypothetical protein